MEEQNLNKNISSGAPKSRYWKFAIGFLVIIILALAGYPIIQKFYYKYKANKFFKDYQNFETQYLDSLKNDTFGGKSPQETYGMFIDALKKGDILSAAKFYYDDEDKIRNYQKFKKMQDAGTLEQWVNELPVWKDMKEVPDDYWDKSVNSRSFDYKYIQKKDFVVDDYHTVKAGEQTGGITFWLSKSAGIIKIETFSATNLVK